ncbi:Uncharacterized protein FKW44_022911 [Caligus rogercresseyi]|uniref:Uncharacterized protein n=1 Tax=Caligus rogercresseyi TaxID=217165 RepID=A0A7T8JUR6_CALRO|nr:Uncharacterized protein FKW44_022911 [Caligus rogercresseyi]
MILTYLLTYPSSYLASWDLSGKTWAVWGYFGYPDQRHGKELFGNDSRLLRIVMGKAGLKSLP